MTKDEAKREAYAMVAVLVRQHISANIENPDVSDAVVIALEAIAAAMERAAGNSDSDERLTRSTNPKE